MTAPPTTRRPAGKSGAGATSKTSGNRPAPVGSIWVRGAFAATWAVMVALAFLVVLSLVVWAADSSSTAGADDVARFAGQLWLLALRDPLRITGGTLVIPPLGLTVLLGLLLARSTAIVARSQQLDDRRGIGTIVAAVTLPFAVLATIVAAVDSSGAFRPTVGAAFVCAAVLGVVATTVGAAWGGGLVRSTWRDLSADVRAALDAAVAGGVVVVTAAAMLLIGSLAVHAHEVGTIVTSYRGGAGQFAMLLLSVLYLPNALVFACGYLIGPGFAVGAGTSVSAGGAHLAAAPAFPLLAAVPHGPAPIVVQVFCGLAVVGAGIAAAWRITRAAEPRAAVRPQLRVVLFAACFAGIAAAVIAAYSGGAAGPGRLRAVGPSPWQFGLAAAAELGVIASLVVFALHWRGSRRQVIDLT